MTKKMLAVDSLTKFKAFLVTRGVGYRDGKGPNQVLQVETSLYGWQPIFTAKATPEFYSVPESLQPIVYDFLNGSEPIELFLFAKEVLDLHRKYKMCGIPQHANDCNTNKFSGRPQDCTCAPVIYSCGMCHTATTILKARKEAMS